MSIDDQWQEQDKDAMNQFPEGGNWLAKMLEGAEGYDFLQEFFTPQDLEEWIRSHCLDPHGKGIYAWDDPLDWIQGMTLALAFNYREYLHTYELENKFRIQLAWYLGKLVRSIEKPYE